MVGRGPAFVRGSPAGDIGMGWEGTMFSSERFEVVVRFAKFVVCLLIAALLVWRSNVYRDPTAPYSLLPSVMCAILALFLVLTGMSIGWKDETDATEAAEAE